LWSPWRHEYITAGGAGSDSSRCVFCELRANPTKDEENFVLHRASCNFIVLNIYPYITGHLLIVPYEHLADLDALAKEASDELMDLTKRCQTALREVYRPAGFNIGMNLGRSAGAGIAGHVHIHVLPRWTGDSNFMSTIAETRVISEELSATYRKLRDHF